MGDGESPHIRLASLEDLATWLLRNLSQPTSSNVNAHAPMNSAASDTHKAPQIGRCPSRIYWRTQVKNKLDISIHRSSFVIPSPAFENPPFLLQSAQVLFSGSRSMAFRVSACRALRALLSRALRVAMLLDTQLLTRCLDSGNEITD